MPLDVADFWISDPRMAVQLGAVGAETGSEEQLLVRERGEDLDVSLYIDAAVVGRLEEDDPTVRLHAGNLGDFCTVLEGVSHFVYLTWNAGYARPVSLLELELQAEVDKYVAAAFLFGRQRDGRIPGGLARWLFADPKFAAHLSELCAKRYWAANQYAAKFCSDLQHRYFRRRGHGGLVNELRRFYRLTQDQKIEHIRTAS